VGHIPKAVGDDHRHARLGDLKGHGSRTGQGEIGGAHGLPLFALTLDHMHPEGPAGDRGPDPRCNGLRHGQDDLQGRMIGL